MVAPFDKDRKESKYLFFPKRKKRKDEEEEQKERRMKQLVSLAIFFVFVGCLSNLVLGQSASGDICQGQVGNYRYNLQQLSTATGGNDVTCQDQGGNTYYYRPCQALQQQACKTISDPTPAACQKDIRKIPQFHDSGSTAQVTW